MRVVIIGGGFAGLNAAKGLADTGAEITLIDRRNFHLFQPLLYQVATGGLSPGDVASPLRWILRKQKNTRVLLGDVASIDAAAREVVMNGAAIGYDVLVVATGATHSYFGHNEWAEIAPGLKTVEDATQIRQRIFIAFEAAERETDPELRRQWLTFVVVGGGPTGVELAGALGEIARDTLKDDFRAIRSTEARILLLDASPRILPSYPEELSAAAERSLIRVGVRCRSGVRVTSIDAEGVQVEGPDGTERIPARTVLWAAGVRASKLGRAVAEATGAPTDAIGRVMVTGDLTVPGHPEIFVVGDLAAFAGPNGKPLPGVAPVAMQQGRYAAAAIRARIEGSPAPPVPFRYRDKGSLATIGRAKAIADFGFLRLSGFVAWVLWLFIHLMYLVGFQNRVVVLVQWAFEYFTFNRGARLITGASAPAPVPETSPTVLD